jgi:hypothetical protein
MGAVASAALVVLVELGFLALNTFLEHDVKYERSSVKFQPNQPFDDRLLVDGKVVYDVTYSINDVYRRETPGTASTDAQSHLLFFGCSFTFGQGLEDAETLPAVVARSFPDVHVANYGGPGEGPQNTLHLLLDPNITHRHEGKSVTVVYTYLPVHVLRTIGSMAVITGYGRDHPCYRPDANGGFTYRGTLSTWRPRVTAMYDLLQHEQVLKYFKQDWPILYTDSDLDFTFSLLAACRDLANEHWDVKRFVVVFYPAYHDDLTAWKRAAAAAKRAGIEYLDYSNLFQGRWKNFELPFDRHPTAGANEELGRELSIALEPTLSRAADGPSKPSAAE